MHVTHLGLYTRFIPKTYLLYQQNSCYNTQVKNKCDTCAFFAISGPKIHTRSFFVDICRPTSLETGSSEELILDARSSRQERRRDRATTTSPPIMLNRPINRRVLAGSSCIRTAILLTVSGARKYGSPSMTSARPRAARNRLSWNFINPARF